MYRWRLGVSGLATALFLFLHLTWGDTEGEEVEAVEDAGAEERGVEEARVEVGVVEDNGVVEVAIAVEGERVVVAFAEADHHTAPVLQDVSAEVQVVEMTLVVVAFEAVDVAFVVVVAAAVVALESPVAKISF